MKNLIDVVVGYGMCIGYGYAWGLLIGRLTYQPLEQYFAFAAGAVALAVAWWMFDRQENTP